jgi:hypothetical protein
MIETLAEAHDSRMTLTARCAWGPREGMKSIRECKARVEIDLETLIWTRGERFPILMLESCRRLPAARLLVARPVSLAAAAGDIDCVANRIRGTVHPVWPRRSHRRGQQALRMPSRAATISRL